MNIAIIEDNPNDKDILQKCISDLFSAKKISYEKIDYFSDVPSFDLTKKYDLIFIDIILNDQNGFELSKKIRTRYSEEETFIVFTTTLNQYAIEGYSVGASGYILKPYTYEEFAFKMTPLISKLIERQKMVVTIYTREKEFIKISTDDILYIESKNHYLTYHTKLGNYETRKTLSQCEEELKSTGLSKISKWCLVSLKNITKIDGNSVYINTEELPISRSMKKEFLSEFARYYGI